MFASIHAWLIYIRVAQDRAIACELPGQLTEDGLDYSFFFSWGSISRSSFLCHYTSP